MSSSRQDGGGVVDRLPRFLLVDGDERGGHSVHRALRLARPRWVLISVGSAAAAMRALSASPYDVLIADLDLSDTPGTALLEYTRHRHPEVARVVFSTRAEASAHHPEVGAAHVLLDKPTTPEQLVSKLAAALLIGAGIRGSHSQRPPQGTIRRGGVVSCGARAAAQRVA